MRKIKKRNIRFFCAAAIFTALVILFLVAVVCVEANTRAIGIDGVATPFAVEFFGNEIALTVNDRRYSICYDFLKSVFQSKIFTACVAVWMVI